MLRNIDLSVIVNLRFQTIIYLLLLFIASLFIHLLATSVLLANLGYSVSTKNLFSVNIISYSANYASPIKIGIPLRVYLYREILNIPLSVGVVTISVINVLGVILASCISIFGIRAIFSSFSYSMPLTLFVILSILVLTVIFMPVSKFGKFLSFGPFKKKASKILTFAENVQIGLKRTSKVIVLLIVLLMFTRFFITAYCSHLILLDFGQSISTLHILYAQSISLIVGLVSMVPMGLGSKDVTLVFLLSHIGISKEAAVSLAIVERIIWAALPLLIGIICANSLGIKFFSRKNKKEIVPQDLTEVTEKSKLT